MNNLYTETLNLLQTLIATPSLSGEEDQTATLLADFIRQKGYTPQCKDNNVWVKSRNFDTKKPTILLNSHHDTVKPNVSWTKNPYQPTIEDGKLFGLGSNDAGASLVCLLAAFLHLEPTEQPYNLVYVASAEEENSGHKNVASVLGELGEIAVGIVGEPTQMQAAIAEKGLLVLDCTAYGKAGHAARNEGVNAIYKALQDIQWLQNYEFPKVSEVLGKVKMTVTQIEAGSQHNVVPDRCKFVVDIRVTECYTNEEVFEIVQKNLQSEAVPRSFRLNSSGISLSHPLVQRCLSLGMSYYGSPTLSDQAVMPFTTLKLGVGDSARSHTADEFVYLHEIEQGIQRYIEVLDGLVLYK